MKIFYFIALAIALLIFPEQPNRAQQNLSDTSLEKDVDLKKMEEKRIAHKVRNSLDSINRALTKLKRPQKKSKPPVNYRTVTVYRDTCFDKQVWIMQPPTLPDSIYYYNEPEKKTNFLKRLLQVFKKKKAGDK